MDIQIIASALPSILKAAAVTLYVALAGIIIGQVLGAIICFMALSGPRWLRAACATYISFFRGVPTLVKVLLIYYALPSIGIELPAAMTAIIALGLMSAAYVAEIYRGALRTIPPGQVEAARMVGMSTLNTWKRILIPQALRRSVPALTNEAGLTLKASSLVSVVGVGELTSTSQHISAATFSPVQIGLATAAIYFGMNLLLATIGNIMERRFSTSNKT